MNSPAGGGPNGSFSDEDLHAYVDGRLSPERRAEIQGWLDSDPEAASRAAFYHSLVIFVLSSSIVHGFNRRPFPI